MASIRKIKNSTAGIMSFMLVFFFLVSGIARGLSCTAQYSETSKSVLNCYKTTTKYASFLSDESNAYQWYAGQLNDSDIDDACFLQPDDTLQNHATALVCEYKFAEFVLCSDNFTIPLYDLFCNWKLHIA